MLRPVGTRAREFVEQLGAALAEHNMALKDTTIRLRMNDPVEGTSMTIGHLANSIAKEVGIEFSEKQPYLTLREGGQVLDIARIRELAKYTGIGYLPNSALYMS